jgi:osmotically-inducible protein OsmY
MHLLALPGGDHQTSTRSCPTAVVRQAEERFRRSGYLALREVSCLAGDGVVTLQGRLPSHYLKQVAQEIASGLEGVHRVVNRIKVYGPAGRSRAEKLRLSPARESSRESTATRREHAPLPTNN